MKYITLCLGLFTASSLIAIPQETRKELLIDLIGLEGPGINKIKRISKTAPADEYAVELLEVAKPSDQEVRVRVVIAIWRMRSELTADKRKYAAQAITGMEKKRDEFKKWIGDLNDQQNK